MIEAIVEKHTSAKIDLYRAIPEVESISDEETLGIVLLENISPM
jgi:hypothetical protein